METKKYFIELSSGGCRFTRKPLPKIGTIVVSILEWLLIIFLAGFSVFCFLHAGYFYAVCFLFCAAIFAFVYIRGAILANIKQKVFHFDIYFDGIHHYDADGVYFLPWDDVKNYGFIDKVLSSHPSSKIRCYQTCLYFSVCEHEELQLRKVLEPQHKNFYLHYSKPEMIVLELYEDTIDQTVMDTINSYITMYCDKEKENSFIINDPDYPY